MNISIQEVKTKQQLQNFIHFKHKLYAGDLNYIPALNLKEKIFLGKKNPFFEHSEAAYFLAYSENKIVGRIAAIYNKIHLQQYNDTTGFFGFLDGIEDSNVFEFLINTASKWLNQRGIKHLIGPENFTTNDSVGILTSGFDQPPVVQMPYNKSYYERLLLHCGLSEQMELYAYRFQQVDLPLDFLAKGEKLEQRLQQKGITIRPINFKQFNKEMKLMREVYNTANENHWGFVPLSEKEFMFLAADLKQIVAKENVLFAEKDGKLIGYIVTVPDVNQIFTKIPNGKLLPFSWTNLIWKPKIIGARMLILGVSPAYRKAGIDWCFYARMSIFFQATEVKWTEACYVMKENTMMNRIIKKLGGERVKTYRLFGKAL